MARGDPASPLAESLADSDRLAPGCALTAELAAFIHSGISIIVGSVGGDGRPIASVGLACSVDHRGLTRVIVRRPACAPVIRAVEAGSQIAATFSRPFDHRSIQLKARSARLVPVEPEDEARIGRQTTNFRRELIGVDHTEDFARLFTAYESDELAVIAFVPDRAFVQTPGPGAGACLTE